MGPKVTATYGSASSDVIRKDQELRDQESTKLIARGDSESSVEAEGYRKYNGLESEYCCTWMEYFTSWRFIELILCVVPFLAIWIYFEYAIVVPHMRPIPLQHVVGVTGDEVYNEIDPIDSSRKYLSYANTIWNSVNNEKFLGDTVPHRENQVLMGVCPFLLQLFLAWFLAPIKKGNGRFATDFHRWDTVHRTTCVYFVGIGTTNAVTNLVKNYVGYLRPVFLDLCQPFFDEKASQFVCADETNDGRTSFPSDHSSWGFCGMLLLSLYLERRFGLSSMPKNERTIGAGHNTSNFTKSQIVERRDRQAKVRLVSMLCFSPMVFAIFVAATRVVDNKHFPADVIGGAVLGGSIAFLSYGIWFPQE
mmetsp:Transcript_20998/g.44062  ORF Transcript_20998/g.44062 Transcript_20998/m.44062 type:complete len:363 (-) Transcript_20998:45-1133(-)|eukprot:CAMPEP_0201142610 /NCGR_PEP_ID=MMETSP0851-20130426/4267_1 /ASSEMBLY_ACC=CAM_ASM_000631 /TAXON_ID=183588 /ORGANISM="Pseudo-nitzschia fraudulenta, Strain WWA7" /LENGTH=362 /DNA_ID=CAMNT_0047416347 /DNA_START=93 /DNA_END=1181 /DNA_ORIENTATION=-